MSSLFFENPVSQKMEIVRKVKKVFRKIETPTFIKIFALLLSSSE